MTDEITVEIDFEVGHVSIIRAEPTTAHNPPRTHDWRVYLRSTDVHGDLNCLIQRCVFYLHPEFPNSKRELKCTPFAIHETGYAGFHLPIDIYFKTKKEPKKFRIEYDLDLHTNVEGHPQRQKESYVRKYRCTFYNPDSELRQKILSAGGKIKDAPPISTHHNESDDSNTAEEPISTASEQPIARHSPPQKRTFSPVPTNPLATTKKVKVEQAIANPKKKQQSSSVPKNETSTKPISTTINIKKSQLALTTKPSPAIEDKPVKTTTNPTVDDPSSTKTLPKIKIKPDPDSKSAFNPLPKKKEPVPSPSKPANQPPPSKKPIPSLPATKPPPPKLSTVNQSPSNVNIKRESSPITNSTNASALISSLKKIPKKVLPPPPPPPTMEKRTRSPMTPPPPSSRNSDRSRHQASASKSQSSSKRDRRVTPPSSTNNSSNSRSSSSNRSGKHSSTNSSNRGRSRSRSRSRSHSRNRSSHSTHPSSRSQHSSRHSSQPKDRASHHQSKSSSRHSATRRTPTPPKTTRANQSQSDLPTSIRTPQSRPASVEPTAPISSPSGQVFPSEDDHTQTPMDIDGQSDDDRRLPLSDEHEQIPSTRNFHSEQSYSSSDLNESNDESNLSLNDEDEEENLPTVLTDEELRSKLIFIYKRFKLNSSNDLSVFVTFFKRHHLIDISSKSNSEMFTYDLLSLDPLLLDELAADLGYTNPSN